MSGHCNKCNMNIIGICVPNVLQLVQQNPISYQYPFGEGLGAVDYNNATFCDS